MALLAAASLTGFRALSTTARNSEHHLGFATAVVSAWLPVLLLANVFLAAVLQLFLDDTDFGDSLGIWLWGSMLVVDIVLLGWCLRRRFRSDDVRRSS